MSNESLKDRLIEIIDSNRDAFCDASKAIWNHPELAMQEYFAQETLTNLLEENGFAVEKGVAGLPTSFIATFGSGKPVIGFSSEFDALPGLSQKCTSNFQDPVQAGAPGHGCGHNLIAVGGIQAAIALSKVMTEEKIEGTLKVFGSPAEEICVGKPFMAREGCFEGLDAVVDWHPANMNHPGYRSCPSYFNIKFHFTGKSAHGNAPWHGVSALDAAMLMGHAIEIMREHVYPGPESMPTTVNYAFPDCGNAYPVVVPDKAIVWVVGRSYDADLGREILAKVRAAAEGVAIATGTTVTEELTSATHNMIPNKVLADVYYNNFVKIGGPERSEEDQANAKEIQTAIGGQPTGYTGGIIEVPEVPGGQPVTDASEYSWFAPLGLATVALSPSPDTAAHNWAVTRIAGSDLGMDTVCVASKLLALSAFDLIANPDILKAAQDENIERLGGRTYETLLPDDLMPDVNTNKDLMDKFRVRD